ncbi:MAG: 2Fe-2S iron-sulfur cluster-binding protein [Spirochaetia bacterium]|uniref:(2Fe-2S)-binding protein n=1 Tax=Treponema berlinense TaxID=225004 RepID=UPI0026EA2F07|nr:2Fe-2S iron-sulfur cluster-binding protein [Treponema berlinense]MDD5789273.1 2Fe-2S iron-sulfur cluster-binding protein [Spirochaetia bacterium]
MKIPITINGEKMILDEAPDEKLLFVLRKRKLISVKIGCEEGKCGFCTVLLNDKPVSSCLIPVGIVKDCTIETLEYFSKSPEYKDIEAGFSKAGMNLCGYCNSFKFFSVYRLLKDNYRPSKEQLLELAAEDKCSCTEQGVFMNGILYATAKRHEREGRKKNVKD